MLRISLFVIVVFMATRAQALGFDPGMRLALAASLFPNEPLYLEQCPNAPGGHCYGTIPNGGGFYTLPYDLDESLGRSFGARYRNRLFRWLREDNELIAELTVDATDTALFPSTATPNLYNGLQLNTEIAGAYTGISLRNTDQTPSVTAFDAAEFEFRAKFCPHGADPYFLTLLYYASYYAPRYNTGLALAFHYGFAWTGDVPPFTFQSPYISQGALMRRIGMTDAQASPFDTTIFIDAHRFGFLPMPPQNSAIRIDTSVDCGLAMASIPWRHVSFPVQRFVKNLDAQHMISPWAEHRYAGGIIAGIEQWGRGMTVLQVRRHRLRPIGDTAPPPAGYFRNLQDNSLWYSNGVTVCQYVNLTHAHASSADAITATVPTVPAAWSPIWCPGADTIPPWDD